MDSILPFTRWICPPRDSNHLAIAASSLPEGAAAARDTIAGGAVATYRTWQRGKAARNAWTPDGLTPLYLRSSVSSFRSWRSFANPASLIRLRYNTSPRSSVKCERTSALLSVI